MMRSTEGSLHGPLGKRLRIPSPIYDHANISGHHTKLDNFSIVGRNSHTISINDSSLNRNIGKYQLPHILDEVLLNTLDLHLK